MSGVRRKRSSERGEVEVEVVLSERWWREGGAEKQEVRKGLGGQLGAGAGGSVFCFLGISLGSGWLFAGTCGRPWRKRRTYPWAGLINILFAFLALRLVRLCFLAVRLRCENLASPYFSSHPLAPSEQGLLVPLIGYAIPRDNSDGGRGGCSRAKRVLDGGKMT